VQSQATLWERCEDAVQSAAFSLNMLKTNDAARRLHSVLVRAPWERCGSTIRSSRVPWARGRRPVCTLYRRRVNPII